MKLNLSTIRLTLLLAVTLTIASCAKDGDVGPAGPAGPQGPAGTAGTPGTPGSPGAPGTVGTANVIYSAWLNVTYEPNADSSVWVAEIEAPQLVDSILNQGDIKVYWNIGSDSATDQFIVTLPTLDLFIGIDVVTVNPYFAYQAITLLSNFDASSVLEDGKNYQQYRYVLIPGGVEGGRVASTVNWNDYNEVKKFLGLKD